MTVGRVVGAKAESVRWRERLFYRKYGYPRIALVAAFGLAYLLVQPGHDQPLGVAEVAFGLASIGLGFGAVRWPLVTVLAEAAVLAGAVRVGDGAVSKVGAAWTLLELALAAPTGRLAIGAGALTVVYLTSSLPDSLGHLPDKLYGTVFAVAGPALVGLHLRALGDLTRQAEERAAERERRRESEHRAGRAAERAAIARELHDLVAHHVASIVLRVDVARRVLPTSDDRMAEVLRDVQDTGSAALADLRGLVAMLRDPEPVPTDPGTSLVDPAGLPDALEAAVVQGRRMGLRVDATVDPAVSRLDAPRALALLRLVQEALVNVAKHAGPADVRLSAGLDDDGVVRLEVRDSGPSGQPATDQSPAPLAGGTGLGLVGMRERVNVFGGDLAAGPEGSGWYLRATLPPTRPHTETAQRSEVAT